MLIDEAELHLHYDAQADLMQMLARQTIARKVIYTTHSIGCLPEDFGTGVRMVTQKDAYSEIVNQFWAQNRPGMSALLFGMGAATMAFLPVRYCVLSEGASDMLLLPTLLREVMDLPTLGFQVSPGLAQASKDQVAILRNEGLRVAFLVDGDEGGTKIIQKLKRAEVPDHLIINLVDAIEEICVIEDFVDKTIYVNAVNLELERSSVSDRFKIADMPLTMRPTAVENWCKTKNISEPPKVAIAYHILDQINESKLADKQHSAGLRIIYERIMKIFDDQTDQID